MSRPDTFIFKDYSFDVATGRLVLTYGLSDGREFRETFTFNFDFVSYDPEVLERAIEILFFVAGVSYYKAYLPGKIIVQKGRIDAPLAEFLSRTWQGGLGEFFYVNQLDPRTSITFPVNHEPLASISTEAGGKLVGIGGGKDSLVSVELLRGRGDEVTTWSLNHRSQLEPLIARIGTKHLWVDRAFDRQLLELKDDPEAYNGHVPISAIIAAVGTVVGVLSGIRDHVVSNEKSANAPTLTYQGVAINHQYSKSQAFEADYQALLMSRFGGSYRYYSLLRPLSEMRISELFAPHFDHYHDVFSSCNRAFVHDSTRLFWDGTCSKCAFVCLMLTPFVEQQKLDSLFGGNNLVVAEGLIPTYRQLLGIEGDKPLDCVGEIEESRAAMDAAKAIYPELAERYYYDMTDGYNYKAKGEHLVPADVRVEELF